MVTTAHYVELRETDVLKTFTSKFDREVERYETLHRLVEGAELPSGWCGRVPALLESDPDTSSVVMTRAQGGTIYHAVERGQDVPWEAVGAALGHLHRGSAGAEGAPYVHGDAAPNNIMFCPDAREVWLIDPAVKASRSPWQDLLCLQWVIFRRGWGFGAAVDLFRGWRLTRGTVDVTDIDEGWAAVLAQHFAPKPSLMWARHALRLVFRRLWVPLALWLSRRP